MPVPTTNFLGDGFKQQVLPQDHLELLSLLGAGLTLPHGEYSGDMMGFRHTVIPCVLRPCWFGAHAVLFPSSSHRRLGRGMQISFSLSVVHPDSVLVGCICLNSPGSVTKWDRLAG